MHGLAELIAYFICSRKNKFEIRVHLSSHENATGVLYWDDGESNGKRISCSKKMRGQLCRDSLTNFVLISAPYITGNYNEFELTATNNDLRMTAVHSGYADAEMYLGYVQIRGVRGNVTAVVVDNVDFPVHYNTEVANLLMYII